MTPRTRKVAWAMAAIAAGSTLTGIGWDHAHAYAEGPGNVHLRVCVRDSVMTGVQVSGTDPAGVPTTTKAADIDGTKENACANFGEWRIGTNVVATYTSSNPPVVDPGRGQPTLLDPNILHDGGTFDIQYGLGSGPG
jgi:hypothetical protein